jgi:hypothetical protein
MPNLTFPKKLIIRQMDVNPTVTDKVLYNTCILHIYTYIHTHIYIHLFIYFGGPRSISSSIRRFNQEKPWIWNTSNGLQTCVV